MKTLDRYENFVTCVKVETRAPAAMLILFHPNGAPAELVLANDSGFEKEVPEKLRKIADQIGAKFGNPILISVPSMKGPPEAGGRETK